MSSFGDQATTLPLEDLLEMPTWIAFAHDGQDRPELQEHRGYHHYGDPASSVTPSGYCGSRRPPPVTMV